jgi:hypothetical protein
MISARNLGHPIVDYKYSIKATEGWKMEGNDSISLQRHYPFRFQGFDLSLSIKGTPNCATNISKNN